MSEFTMKRFLPFAIIVIVAIAALAAAFYSKRSIEDPSAASAAANTAAQPAKPDPFPAPGAEPPHSFGAEDAKIVLEEFADFQCPACANVSPVLKSIEHEFKGQVRVIFREFPMFPQHQQSVIAARVAEAAGLQNKFWEMHDTLYRNQAAWSKSSDVGALFENYATEIGLDVARFKRDVPSEAVRTRLALDLRRARTLKVKGTPTVYLNGAELSFAQTGTVEGLRKIVKEALQKK